LRTKFNFFPGGAQPHSRGTLPPQRFGRRDPRAYAAWPWPLPFTNPGSATDNIYTFWNFLWHNYYSK